MQKEQKSTNNTRFESLLMFGRFCYVFMVSDWYDKTTQHRNYQMPYRKTSVTIRLNFAVPHSNNYNSLTKNNKHRQITRAIFMCILEEVVMKNMISLTSFESYLTSFKDEPFRFNKCNWLRTLYLQCAILTSI